MTIRFSPHTRRIDSQSSLTCKDSLAYPKKNNEHEHTIVIQRTAKLDYLFILAPFSSRRGSKDVLVEKCQVNGTGRFDDVTNSVLP